MRTKVITLILIALVLSCGICAAATYYPSSTRITLIALENNQTFNATEGGSHTFHWYVNDTLVQTDAAASESTYIYPPTPWRTDEVSVEIDSGSPHIWTVKNDLNKTAAMRTVTALNNMSWEMNLSNYSLFNAVQTTDYNNTTQLSDLLFLPITAYWLDTNIGVGYWFYACLIVGICGLFYYKFENMTVVSMVLLILSIIVAVPGTTGDIVVPSSFLNLMYIAVVMGIIGTFSGLLRD